MNSYKIIIDTDPGIDDGLAIMLALACAEFDILGLTSIFGNVPVDLATENALRLLALAERTEIPVVPGASRSWGQPYKGAKASVHGEDGQGNVFSPSAAQNPLKISAAEFIVDQISQCPNEVTLVALGPLTNLADALKRDPEIQHQVKEVVFMGGNAFSPGNTNPVAEANILSDPEAADFVLEHHWPMTMVGLDVTQKTYLPASMISELGSKSSAIGKQVFGAYQHYLKFYKEVNQMDGTWVHDSSAFIYLLNKEIYQTSDYPIRVETADSISRGKTWPSVKDYSFIPGQHNPWLDRPKVKVCVDVNGEAAIQLLKYRLMNTVFPNR